MIRRVVVPLAFFLLSLASPPTVGAVLHAGDPAPNFTKTDLDGMVHSLNQYRGKVVVLFVLGYG